MSSWPWMKNCSCPIADATTAPDTYATTDPRPLVEGLICEHRELIDEMVLSLSNNTNSSDNETSQSPTTVSLFDHAHKHDDLWCLRFLLSHKKNLEKAIAAARTTLKFRYEYHLDEADLRESAPQHVQNTDHVKNFEGFRRFMASGILSDNGSSSIVYTVPDPKRLGTVMYINIGSLDTHQLGEVAKEDWITALTYVNEWNYQWLDYLTRTTGRLTKSIRIVDVSTARLHQFDKICQRKYTDAIAVMEDCFPQAVQNIFVCFAPVWIQVPWRIIRPFMPVRVVEKLDFVDPIHDEKDKARMIEIIPKEHLAVQFGGTNTECFAKPAAADLN